MQNRYLDKTICLIVQLSQTLADSGASFEQSLDYGLSIDIMVFRYYRTIRFNETDAAGVVYFANVLTLCHEAYEAALSEISIDLAQFFSISNPSPVPIVHAEADYFKPLFCGDRIAITLIPAQLTAYSYDVGYTFNYQQPELSAGPSNNQSASKSNQLAKPLDIERPLATALTRHVCINKATRKKQPISPQLTDWITDLAASVATDD